MITPFWQGKLNSKNNCYRLLFEEKRYLNQTRFDNYIFKKYLVNYIRLKEKVHETRLGGLRCFYFFQSLRCGKTGNKLNLCNLSCNEQNELNSNVARFTTHIKPVL